MKIDIEFEVELSDEEVSFLLGGMYDETQVSFLELSDKGLIEFDTTDDPYLTVLGEIVRDKLKQE